MRAAAVARIRAPGALPARVRRAMIGGLSPGVLAGLLALLLGCVALLGGIAAELRYAPAIAAVAGGSTGPAPAPASPRDDDHVPALPPLRALAEVVDRPLFVANRRPIPVATPAADANRPLDLVIAGIIVSTTGDRVALLQRRGVNAVVHLHQGQEIDGWKLVTVLADRIVIERGALRQELRLRDEASHAAPHR